MDKKNVRNVLVVGAGVMGHSIAQVFAGAGIAVRLADVDEKALDRAMGLIESGLNTMADFGKISRNRIPSILSRITPSRDLAGMAGDADFIIEAVPEIPSIKKEVFSQLDRLCPDDTIIASNTSGLDIFSIADVKRPERLVIAHFFAPAHIIPLVEIVSGARTSPDTVSFTVTLMERVGKSPVLMKKFGPGFIVNRIQKAIAETALEMIEQGLVGPEEIDRAVKLSLGIRLPIVGVVQTMDFNGLDMVLDTMRNYGKIYSFVEEKVSKGHFGVKTSKGIYDYQGRSEAEILKKRDELYLKMLEYLQKIDAFDPV
ncbi:MAG: 3-hydroxyacyl-CoA dehydrogenase family protein [Desulfobacterales bacterium]|nr:3-hydroxyacyl-CoA dehydrogenase family protein [Desulfobacterales bacterium]